MEFLNNWMDILPWFGTDQCISALVRLEDMDNDNICNPKYEDIFNAYSYCGIHDVKVVMIGSLPYSEYSNGLAYGVRLESPSIPTSLSNLFLELQLDYGRGTSDISLASWAKQGVMLLNSSLTTDDHIDWAGLINDTVYHIGQNTSNTVFVLFGDDPLKYISNISAYHHHIIRAPDPSSYKFFGTRIFTETNNYLNYHDRGAINWW